MLQRFAQQVESTDVEVGGGGLKRVDGFAAQQPVKYVGQLGKCFTAAQWEAFGRAGGLQSH